MDLRTLLLVCVVMAAGCAAPTQEPAAEPNQRAPVRTATSPPPDSAEPTPPSTPREATAAPPPATPFVHLALVTDPPRMNAVVVWNVTTNVVEGTWKLLIDGLEVATYNPLPPQIEHTFNRTGMHAIHLTGPANHTAQVELWGQPRNWGEPTDDLWLRPGSNHSGCTLNFLFHHKDYRYFMGTAQHCISSTTRCQQPDEAIGDPNLLFWNEYTAGSTAVRQHRTEDTWLAYSSGITMWERGDTEGLQCVGNDFALLELGPEALAVTHPAMRRIGGPTSLGPLEGLAPGTLVHGFGSSSLRTCQEGFTCSAVEDHLDIKHGAVVDMERGGWIYRIYTYSPGIFGDSGSGMLGPSGEAIGVASTIQVAPMTGSNAFTNVAKALDYMEAHEGWAPKLVPWDEFDSQWVA